MSKKFKVGVVGIGRIGWGTSLREIGKYTNLFEIVAACDLIEDRRQKMADQFGCKTYEKIEGVMTKAAYVWIPFRYFAFFVMLY